MMAKFC